MGKPFDDIRENLREIRETIAAACISAGRPDGDVTLMGVTKTVPPDKINMAIAAGLSLIGENRVQEYLDKQSSLVPAIPGGTVEAHLIGHLQTNKVSKIVGHVSMIQSVDSLRIASAISSRSMQLGIVTDILAEVNVGMEDTKFGVDSAAVEEFIAQMNEFSGIRVRGLMAIPPFYDSEREKRAIFSKLYKLFIDIQSKNRDNRDIDVLSMGMSGDYAEAVAEGSTMVRVGSALFGSRM